MSESIASSGTWEISEAARRHYQETTQRLTPTFSSEETKIRNLLHEEDKILVKIRPWKELEYEVERTPSGEKVIRFKNTKWMKWYYNDWLFYPYQVKLELRRNQIVECSYKIQVPVEVIEEVIL